MKVGLLYIVIFKENISDISTVWITYCLHMSTRLRVKYTKVKQKYANGMLYLYDVSPMDNCLSEYSP